jgi:hypothetical protein
LGIGVLGIGVIAAGIIVAHVINLPCVDTGDVAAGIVQSLEEHFLGIVVAGIGIV